MSIKFAKKSFKERLETSLKDDFMQSAMVKAQDRINTNRQLMFDELGHFEEWRGLSEEMRQHVLDNLDYYLTQFAENVVKRGGNVFFAETAAEATDYIQQVAKSTNTRKVVKAKSMVTEEIGVNQALEEIDVKVVETDLAEFILQTDDSEPPSHMVVPSLHMNKEQIRDVFKEKLGYELSETPEELAQFARQTLRNEYLDADMGICGCNFAIAESGSITLVTNEGNADLVMSAPKTQIVVMGMERIVPTFEEVDILVSMLTRSAVGTKMTSYVTFLTGVTEEHAVDGPKEFHVVIVDNGRSKMLNSEFKPVLQCIRCAACLNICPVYRHIGGHTYGSIYSGPVGSILSPLLGGYEDFNELPYACSLCGACTDVCPVKIPLHNLIHRHRQIFVEGEHKSPFLEKMAMKAFAMGTSKPLLYKMGTKIAPFVTSPFVVQGKIKRGVGVLSKWTGSRDLPAFENERFRDWFKNKLKEEME